MRPVGNFLCLLPLLALLIVGGCATTPPGGPSRADEREIAALAQGIRALGADVDFEEAERAARVAFAETHRLALAYQISDSPLTHNTKVNLGLRPRGLCWQWADDLQGRLRQEGFRTLALHRGIANGDNPILIDHSTLIISRRGDTMFQGIVLDPWRKGGELHWTPTLEDVDYRWRTQEEVIERRRRRQQGTVRPAPQPI